MDAVLFALEDAARGLVNENDRQGSVVRVACVLLAVNRRSVPFTSFTFSTSHTAKALTLFGWTPGLRWLVSARILDCGCLAGVYETWSGGRTLIVDEPAPACRAEHHHKNAVLEAA
jgi:hypothetical protein